MASHRPATPGDAGAIAALAVGSIRAYTWFAPEGWTGPGEAAEQELAEYLARLIGTSAWGFVAEDGDGLAGVVTLLPAAEARVRDPDPSLVHLWQLFVAEPHWGSGVAVRLHADALTSSVARGFGSARLFTPAGQARARRFYEREGWAAVADPFFDELIGFDVIEYRRPLTATTPARRRSAGSRPRS
jgi:GNAT superfamily N-acetyltransferase